jgi:hypothetical protein
MERAYVFLNECQNRDHGLEDEECGSDDGMELALVARTKEH